MGEIQFICRYFLSALSLISLSKIVLILPIAPSYSIDVIHTPYERVIERDNLDSTPVKPYQNDDKPRLAGNGLAQKVTYIDLINIANPNRLCLFVLPFFRIEIWISSMKTTLLN